MEVKRYLFQSPYNSPVQFGRPDPSTQTDDTQKLNSNTNETLKKAEIQTNEMKKQVKPSVSETPMDSLYKLDIYA